MPTGPGGLVLCGGSSTRMGTDKALLGAPGRPLALRVADVVARALDGAGAAGPVWLVGGDGARLRGHGAPWRPDGHPGQGPLVAVADALRGHDLGPGGAVVVAACDLPWVTAAAVRQVLDAVRSGDAAAAVARVDGVPQWSLLALGSGGVAAVTDAADHGERSFHRALRGRAQLLEARDPGALRDVDGPDDLPPDLARPGRPDPDPEGFSG